jgi:hypothetical protein
MQRLKPIGLRQIVLRPKALRRKTLRLLALAALVPAIAACSTDLSLNNVTLVPKPDQLLRKPDWATFSGGKNDFELRPITPADLVAPDGSCPIEQGQASGFADSSAAGGAPQAAPPPTGGISLQMTECDVVRRAGPVEQIDIGANQRGDRVVTLTYIRGPSPGIYRFTGGRLASIERAPGPPPAPAKPQKATKKPAGT